jgi:hypothetical protein
MCLEIVRNAGCLIRVAKYGSDIVDSCWKFKPIQLFHGVGIRGFFEECKPGTTA